MKKNNISKLIMVILAAVLLAGCTTNPYTGESQASRAALGGVGGAAVGAGIGALVGGSQGALIGGAIGAVAGGATGGYMDYQNNELGKQLRGTGVQLVKRGNETQLIMPADVTYKFDSSDINASFYHVLNSVAVVLKKYNKTNIVVSGYTDNVGSASYNQTLSERRAKSVGSYLIAQGISSNRVFTQGFGERNPVASNSTTIGRAKNRRVVITLRQMG